MTLELPWIAWEEGPPRLSMRYLHVMTMAGVLAMARGFPNILFRILDKICFTARCAKIVGFSLIFVGGCS